MGYFKIILVLLALTVANFAFAQGGEGMQPPSDTSSSGQESVIPDVRFTTGTIEEIDQELNVLTTQLNLSEDQKIKARSILEERQKKVIEVRDVKYPVAKPGEAPSPEGGAAMDKVLSEAHGKMLTILDEEQKKKYDLIDINIQVPAQE